MLLSRCCLKHTHKHRVSRIAQLPTSYLTLWGRSGVSLCHRIFSVIHVIITNGMEAMLAILRAVGPVSPTFCTPLLAKWLKTAYINKSRDLPFLAPILITYIHFAGHPRLMQKFSAVTQKSVLWTHTWKGQHISTAVTNDGFTSRESYFLLLKKNKNTSR